MSQMRKSFGQGDSDDVEMREAQDKKSWLDNIMTDDERQEEAPAAPARESRMLAGLRQLHVSLDRGNRAVVPSAAPKSGGAGRTSELVIKPVPFGGVIASMATAQDQDEPVFLGFEKRIPGLNARETAARAAEKRRTDAEQSFTSLSAKVARAGQAARVEPVRQEWAAGGAPVGMGRPRPQLSVSSQALLKKQYVLQEAVLSVRPILNPPRGMVLEIPKEAQTNYIRILANIPRVTDASNHDLPEEWSLFSSIMTMNDRSREKHFIAHAIPGWNPSKHCRANTWIPTEVSTILIHPQLFLRSMEIAKVFLKHVGIEFHIQDRLFDLVSSEHFTSRLSGGNHNQMRMSRILSFFKTLDLASSIRLFAFLAHKINSEKNPRGILYVSDETLEYWRSVVYPGDRSC
jgi:hypothetical protein